MSLLDQAKLPYGGKDDQAASAPATTLGPTPTSTPASVPSGPPATSILSGANLPFKPGDKPASTQPQGDSPLWTALQKPTTSIADLWDAAKLTGQGVGDYARVYGNNAIVPNALDRGLSMMPWSGGLEAEKAKTAAATKDLGSFAEVPEWQGQNYNIAAAANRLTGGNAITQAIADSPFSQGVIQGVGTVLGGNYDPMTIAKNAGTAVLESKAGKAVGSTVAAGASYLGNSAKALAARAEEEAQAAYNASDYKGYARALQKKMQIGDLSDLQNLHYQSLVDSGADVAAKARDLANRTSGAAADAYNRVADTVSKESGPLASKAKEWAGDAATGALGWFTGGPLAGAVAAGANKYANAADEFARTKASIDAAFPVVTNYVKGAVDPSAIQQGFSNAAITAGGDFNAVLNKVRTFSPTAAIRAMPGSSWLGY